MRLVLQLATVQAQRHRGDQDIVCLCLETWKRGGVAGLGAGAGSWQAAGLQAAGVGQEAAWQRRTSVHQLVAMPSATRPSRPPRMVPSTRSAPTCVVCRNRNKTDARRLAIVHRRNVGSSCGRPARAPPPLVWSAGGQLSTEVAIQCTSVCCPTPRTGLACGGVHHTELRGARKRSCGPLNSLPNSTRLAQQRHGHHGWGEAGPLSAAPLAPALSSPATLPNSTRLAQQRHGHHRQREAGPLEQQHSRLPPWHANPCEAEGRQAEDGGAQASCPAPVVRYVVLGFEPHGG